MCPNAPRCGRCTSIKAINGQFYCIPKCGSGEECCGTDLCYNPNTQWCCQAGFDDKRVYELATQDCCGGQVYEKTTQGCCNQEIYNPEEKECCLNQLYDFCPSEQIRNTNCECDCVDDKEKCGNSCYEWCPDGQTRDETTCECVCPEGQELCGDVCYDVCDGGQVRNANCECECSAEMPNKCGNVCCVGDCNATGDGCGCPDGEILCGQECCLVCDTTGRGCCNRVTKDDILFAGMVYDEESAIQASAGWSEEGLKEFTGLDDVTSCRGVYDVGLRCCWTEYEEVYIEGMGSISCTSDDECSQYNATCRTLSWTLGVLCCF